MNGFLAFGFINLYTGTFLVLAIIVGIFISFKVRKLRDFREKKSGYLMRQPFLAAPEISAVKIDSVELEHESIFPYINHLMAILPGYTVAPGAWQAITENAIYPSDRGLQKYLAGKYTEYARDYFWDWVWVALCQAAQKDKEKYEHLNNNRNAYSTRELPPDWQDRKRAVAERDENICVLCGEPLRSGHTHHIQRRSDGGDHTTMNLVSLCSSCHEVMEGHEGMHGSGFEVDSQGVVHSPVCSLIDGARTVHVDEYPEGYSGCPTCKPVQSAGLAEERAFIQARYSRLTTIESYLIENYPVSGDFASEFWQKMSPPQVHLTRMKQPKRDNAVRPEYLELAPEDLGPIPSDSTVPA